VASTLDHMEKTLADAYRKEIDQEENIWRSLPFFAATPAWQLAALLQIFDRLPQAGKGAWWDSMGCTTIASLATLTALGFLAVSIFPARFRYLAPEPELLDYAARLDLDERQTIAMEGQEPFDALARLKQALAQQYAVATHHNRQIDQQRARWRSIAGVATLMSVLATLALVATVAAHYVPKLH
jgi:hypothetical protein